MTKIKNPVSTLNDPSVRTKIWGLVADAIQAVGSDPKKIKSKDMAWAVDRLHKQLDHVISTTVVKKHSTLWAFARKAKINQDWLSEYDLSKESFLHLLLKHPHILLIANPRTLKSGFKTLKEFLENYQDTPNVNRFLLKKPTLWNKNFTNFKTNFTRTAEWLAAEGIDKKDFGKVLIKETRLMTQRAEKLHQNYLAIQKFLGAYGVPKEKWAKAFLRAPTLICQSPERLHAYIREVAKLLGPYGVTEEKWAQAAVMSPTLLYYRPKTVESNFLKNAKWAKEYGIKPDELMAAFMKQPACLYRKPVSLRRNYELLRIVTQMPHYIPVPEVQAKLPNKNPAMDRIYALNNGTENWLLRAVMAELVAHKKMNLYAYLSFSRGEVEKTIVAMLGHDPKKKTVKLSAHRFKTTRDQKQFAFDLNGKLLDHANGLRRAWRKNSRITNGTKKQVSPNVLSVILPAGNPAPQMTNKDKQMLLERAIMSGLVQSYKLAA